VLRWDAESYRALGGHTGSYRRWLADPDPRIGARAAALPAWFRPAGNTIAALLSVPADAHHAIVRANANLALAYLDLDDAVIHLRLHRLLTDRAGLVRITRRRRPGQPGRSGVTRSGRRHPRRRQGPGSVT
jgi:hypothetical protein